MRPGPLEVLHHKDVICGDGWFFTCPGAPGISGAGRTFDQSVATAEHAVRQYLTRVAGYDVSLDDARFRVRHVQEDAGMAAPAGPDGHPWPVRPPAGDSGARGRFARVPSGTGHGRS